MLAPLVGIVVAMGISSPATADPAGSIWTIPTQPGPVQSVHGFAITYEKQNQDSAPLGANDFGCAPSQAHPRPVVLVHGTDSSAYSDYAALSPRLAAAGFCVFALNFGRDPAKTTYGTEDLRTSAAQLSQFVEQVLDSTGAPELDIVGYSQGATVARYFINKLGGAKVVTHWVGIASPSHGGTFYGLGSAAAAIPGAVDVLTPMLTAAVVQQIEGSEFLADLNSGGDTVAGVQYVTIGSRIDEMIQPVAGIALSGPNTTNLFIQDLCPVNFTGHFQLPYDPFTLQLAVNALDPEAAQPPNCVPVAPGTGIPEVIAAAH
jgi:triacylglycerol lipase